MDSEKLHHFVTDLEKEVTPRNNINDRLKKSYKDMLEICPECKSHMIRVSGCASCVDCGFSLCHSS